MKQPSNGNCMKTTCISLGLILLILIGFVVGFFTILRDVDASICVPRTAKMLGIEPDLSLIYQHVEKQLMPGMSKDEVMDRLARIGPTRITGTTILSDGNIREGVEIRICLHPLNNITLLNVYSKNWILKGVVVLDDSP